jgi:uncharacterized protein YfeS
MSSWGRLCLSRQRLSWCSQNAHLNNHCNFQRQFRDSLFYKSTSKKNFFSSQKGLDSDMNLS